MCFNATVSITTYVTGLLGCVLLALRKRAYAEALFYSCVVQMQLLEYFLWLDPTCSPRNKKITRLAVLVNHAEPFALYLPLLLTGRLPRWVHAWMASYFVLTVLYSTRVLHADLCTTVTRESDPHLEWKWNDGQLHVLFYSLFLFTLITLCLFLRRGTFQASMVFVSYVVSYGVYNQKKSVGAMWCFAAALAPFVLLLAL